uniref:Radial spoke head 6-like protein A n=1 Tax=Rousettus aegyptiacus TaxID=9407 RepID=A0A7J8CLH0_ROUAE|nr:radial spoke head 6-like protein A [Rousettus aegyptiacus]
MGDPPSDPESPYQQSSRRSQPQPLVPEEVLPVVDAQNLRSNQEMPTSRTNLWGMPQGASRTQPGDHMMFQPEAPQLGGREYPAFPSEFQQRTYLDEVGLQATHDAGLMLQQLQQDQGDLFQPLEAAYPEPQPDFLDPFNMYPREDLQFIQDTQHGPYIRDDPAAQFSPSELAFMPFGTEVQEPEPRELAVQNAKAYLLQTSVSCDLSLYEHLVNLLTKILNQRPEDPLSILESLNRTTQMEWFHPKLDTLRDDPEMQPTYEMAERQKALFGRRGSSGSGEGEQEMEEEVADTPVPNIMESAFYFEQAGVGLSSDESFRIFMALKQLVEQQPILTCRFWGKILGLSRSYLVAQVEFREGEEEGEEEEVEEMMEGGEVMDAHGEEEEEEDEEEDEDEDLDD